MHTRILLTLLTFVALPILKKYTNLSGTVSCVGPGVDSYSRHFGTINK